jgi:hypothetical protein
MVSDEALSRPPIVLEDYKVEGGLFALVNPEKGGSTIYVTTGTPQKDSPLSDRVLVYPVDRRGENDAANKPAALSMAGWARIIPLTWADVVFAPFEDGKTDERLAALIRGDGLVNPLTPEHCEQIERTLSDRARELGFEGMTFFMDRQRYLTPQHNEHVRAVWQYLSGTSSWMSAYTLIRYQRDPKGNPIRPKVKRDG